LLDAGAFLQTIEWAAGIQAVVLGKPSACLLCRAGGVDEIFLRQHCLIRLGEGSGGGCDPGRWLLAWLAALVPTAKYQQADTAAAAPAADRQFARATGPSSLLVKQA